MQKQKLSINIAVFKYSIQYSLRFEW